MSGTAPFSCCAGVLCVRVHDGAGRHGVAVGVPVTASDAWPLRWPVLVAVTSNWYCAWTSGENYRYTVVLKPKEGIWSPASANPLPRKQGDPRKLKNLKARERWRLYKEKGLCPRCGKEPPTSGRTSCTGCLQKIRQYKAQQKSKRTAQAEQTEKATNIGSAQASVNGTGQL